MNSSVTIVLLVVFCVIINDVKSERSVKKVKPVDEAAFGIVGGRNTTIEEAPYQVYLVIYRSQCFGMECGGSIISEKYILTAAHCLLGAKKIDILVGTAYKKNGGVLYNSNKFYIHPLYDSKAYVYDVGVIKIDKGIVLNGITTKIIKLIDEDTDLETGSNILVTGWGRTSENATESSDYLLGVEIPIVSHDECKQTFTLLTPGEFCAGEPGDSGGPAVLLESGIQVGITSYGHGCGFPGVFTNIANSGIRDFIKIITNV